MHHGFSEYKNILLMACRSPWDEEKFNKNCSAHSMPGNRGKLYSYDDGVIVCVEQGKSIADERPLVFTRDWPYDKRGAIGYNPKTGREPVGKKPVLCTRGS